MEEILAIQSQMIAAFLALIDKKVPLLSPGARPSAAETKRTLQDIFPKSNRRSTLFLTTGKGVQRRSNSVVPAGIFANRRVSFHPENTVIVFSPLSTPSLKRNQANTLSH